MENRVPRIRKNAVDGTVELEYYWISIVVNYVDSERIPTGLVNVVKTQTQLFDMTDSQTLAMANQLEMEEEENRKYGCRFCCCICCHVRGAATIIAILELVGVVVGTALQASNIAYSGVSVQWLNVGPLLLYVLFGITTLCVFYAVREHRPNFVVPHIITEILMLFYYAASAIWTGIVLNEGIVIATDGSATVTSDYARKAYGRIMRTDQARVIYAVLTIILFVMTALFCVTIWFVYIFGHLWRYLLEKSVAVKEAGPGPLFPAAEQIERYAMLNANEQA